MQIIIYNQKGGVGKSMLATQVSLHFDTSIIELDPYGMLSQTLDDRVVKIELNEEIPHITEGDVIYDFGGFDDIRLDKISNNANLVIIPFNPTINSLGTTLKSYNRVNQLIGQGRGQGKSSPVDVVQRMIRDSISSLLLSWCLLI